MKIRTLLPALTAIAASSLPIQAATINLDLSSNNSGSITLTDASNNFSFAGFNLDYVIVAGGGGGASTSNNTGRAGGGGGAGGLRQGTTNISGVQTVVVGTGGTGGITTAKGGTGGNSSAFSVTADGGGGGGNNSNTQGVNGGSGGGSGSNNSTAAGTGVAGQGNDGAVGGSTGANRGGGGGGAGGAGVAGNSGGAGGAGLSLSITGSSVTYATGGNGGSTLAQVSATPAAATANTGNGGLGVSPSVSNAYNGGAGGSGIVVVRYTGSQVLTGGLVSTVGGDTVHQFTTTGTSSLDLHSATIGGNISGGGGLVWDKTGALKLSGTNSYTGTTTISFGNIQLSGLIGSTADLLFSSGTLFLDSTGVINVLQSNYSLADANNDITGSFITGAGALQVTTFNDGSNDFTQISVIPEPSAALLGGLGMLMLLRRRRN